MINLIPPAHSQAMRTGRGNARLLRWLAAACLATAGLLIIAGGGWLYLNHQNTKLTRNIDAVNQELESQRLSDVQKKAQQINSNVKVINQVLSREISFSDLIQQIGSVLPNGTILNGLTLGKVDGAIDLSASAKDYNSATQIAVNLSDPKNNIFEKVDIVNINCTATNTAYPCSASFKALFSKSAKNRFINAATEDKR